jgi:SAM-dependent methyltransferase
MLEAARRASPSSVEYRRMSATALDLPDDSFDVVTCITVIQHLEAEEQRAAAAELARVAKPGGVVVVLDLIDLADAGAIVFPRAAEDWIRLYEEEGLRVERWEGQEFIPLIRGFRRVAEGVGRVIGVTGSEQREGASLLEKTRGRGAFRVAYAGLWVLVQLSRLLEPPCRLLLPARWARHGCFRLRKEAVPSSGGRAGAVGSTSDRA